MVTNKTERVIEPIALIQLSFIWPRDSMGKKSISLVPLTHLQCLLKELKNLFKKLTLMKLWSWPMKNGGTLLRCSNTLTPKESSLIIINISINILNINHSISGIQQERLFSGLDSISIQWSTNSISDGHQISLLLSQDSKWNSPVKKPKNPEPNWASLVLNMTKKPGKDFIMKLEWTFHNISGEDFKCRVKHSGNKKERKFTLDCTTLNHLNLLRNALINIWSIGILNPWSSSSQD